MTTQGSPRARAWLAHPLALVVGAVALIALVLLARFPGQPRILGVIGDAAHAPVFGALALVGLAALHPYGGRPSKWSYPIAFSVTVLLGIAVEWIQGQIGRDASWYDVRTDALGAACALSASAVWSARHHKAGAAQGWQLVALGAAAATAVMILWPVAEAADAYVHRIRLFPELAAFEQASDRYFLKVSSGQAEFTELPPPWQSPEDGHSLRVDLSNGQWPGVALTEPQADWRGFSALRVDLTNPLDEPVEITVRVHDAYHDQRYEDRFNRAFLLQPGSRDILRIPVADIVKAPDGRRLDVSRVAGVIIFASDHRATEGREIYISRVWLE